MNIEYQATKRKFILLRWCKKQVVCTVLHSYPDPTNTFLVSSCPSLPLSAVCTMSPRTSSQVMWQWTKTASWGWEVKYKAANAWLQTFQFHPWRKKTVFLSSRSLTLDWPDRRMTRWQAMWRHAGIGLLRSCWTGCTTIRMVRRFQTADFLCSFLTSSSPETCVPTEFNDQILVSLLQLIFGQWGALWESCWRGKSFFLATIVSFISMLRVHCCLQLLFTS